MSAGLPGLGLGGLFFIISALLAPLFELGRTVQGRSSRAAWRAVWRQFAQAAVMVLTVDLALRGLYLFLGATGLAEAPAADEATALPLVAIGITGGLMVAVVVLAKATDLALRAKSAGLPSLPTALPRPYPLRTLATGGTAAVAFFALLAFGAAELSPVPERESRSAPAPGNLASEPPPDADGEAATPSQPGEAGGAVLVAADGRPEGAGTDPAAAPDGDGSGSSDGTSNEGVQPSGQGPGGAVTPGAPGATPGGNETLPASTPPASPPAPGGSTTGSQNGNGGNGNAGEGQGPPTNAGPKETAGPPTGSSAPEHAGPKEKAGPKASE